MDNWDVIVLEQHYLPGGWTHSFTLEYSRNKDRSITPRVDIDGQTNRRNPD
jgi:hypothetical protein